MDEDKIIIIPEKYYMQIYQVGFWFLIIMSIICIAYGFFANEKAWLTYTIIGNVVGEVILIREWFSFGRVIEMDKEGCTVKWRNRSKEYRWSELKTRRIENNIKSCYTNCRKCAVISPYEIKRFRKKDPMSYFINILHWRDWSTFYVYLDSGKINDGKNSYEGGINESIFRGKIAQWGVNFEDVNLRKFKPWEEKL